MSVRKIVKEYIDDSVKPLKTNGYMKLDDLARSYIRNKLRKEYDVNSFKTNLNTVTDNVLDEFLRYINDEASGFLINELTYEDGLVKGSELRSAVQDFIDFNLRENDINEYDFNEYDFNESIDSKKHPYWMDDDVGFDIPDLDDRDIYGDEDFNETCNMKEARGLHTWNITYTGRDNKIKNHIVDATDAYEANRKARRELGISYNDIDDVSMVENRNVRESMRKRNRKISKMKEARHSELTPSYDSRKSFYGKVHIVTDDDGTQILYSYNTPVVEIKDNKVKLLAQWDSSQTTLRHVKEFLQQNGFSVGSKSQLAKMYGNTVESINRTVRKKIRESDNSNYSKWRLIDYFDVWGNEQDSYEVNDLGVVEDDIVISDDSTEQDILDFLFNIGYLKTKDINKIDVVWEDPDFIELFDKSTFYPIGRLEKIN